MKSKIKILIPTLGLILLCGIFIFVYFGKQEKPKLSELQEDQCIQYLTDNGVSIPEGLEASSVREMIAELENVLFAKLFDGSVFNLIDAEYPLL